MVGELGKPARLGVIGSGFVSRGLVGLIAQNPSFTLGRVLTRRNVNTCREFPVQEALTNSVDLLIEQSDIVVECSGDVVYATDVVNKVLDASIPVVTMDAELHVTTGSYLITKGLFTEGEGDQPGSLAALFEDVQHMGFRPLVFGNIKWFLNHNPSREEMLYWSGRLGISLTQVTSFTDGTKVQIEQVLIANGLDAEIVKDGMLGIEANDLDEGANYLAEIANSRSRPISDYILARNAPPGVFITGTHHKDQHSFLKYYKLGDGPYYTITRPYHLCHIELPKTLNRILRGGGPLLHNSERPHASAAAVAKRPLAAGHLIKRGIGSFDVRGSAIEWASEPDHVPIGLMSNAVLRYSLEPDQTICFSDVDIPDSLALRAWNEIRSKLI